MIRVEEINLDPKVRKEMEEQKEKIEQNHVNMNNSNEGQSDSPQKEENPERESKNVFLTKTELGNITRQKEDAKEASAFVENAAEEEELRKLQEERNASQGKKRRKRKQRNKKKEDDKAEEPAKEDPPKISFALEEQEDTQESNGEDSKTSDPPKITFITPDGEVEGEEMDSPTQGQGTPENFEHLKEVMREEGATLRKSSDDDIGLSLGLGSTGLNLAKGHEVHLEKDTNEGQQKIREECEQIKQNIPYNEDDEFLDVVKSEEGKFYSVKCVKPAKIRSIFKSKS